MASYQDLKNAVELLLANGSIASILQLNSATRERAFEAYVFSLVLTAIRNCGGHVELCGIQSGPNPNPIVFRGSPGQMSSAAQDFAYARCSLGSTAFEVHVDVQYIGSSHATHEIDVSIYDAVRADVVRSTGVVPGIRHLWGAIECKFYDSSLGTALGRAFVGLVDDCGDLTVRAFATNGQHVGLARYFSQKRRPEPYFGLTPLKPTAASRFMASLEQAIRKKFGVA